ncbi:MAG: ATP-binding protein [Burkholderiales bacterium]
MTPRRHSAWTLLALNLALALAYYLAARLGLAAAIGASKVTAVWPPSGLALAALMIWGWRAVPGLVVGSFCLNWLGFLGPALKMAAAAALGAAVVSAGSLLQAALAAQLLRGLPRRLAVAPTRETLRFAAVVALACAVAASTGMVTLMELGLVQPGELLYGWLTWWVGDCAGMLVLTPPLLLWLHGAIRRDPIASLAFPVLCIGLGLTLVSSFVVGHLEREARVERFRGATRTLAMTLQHQIDLAQRDLEVLQASYYKVEIDEAEFRRFTGPMLQRSPWQLSFAWRPRVTQAERAGFERSLGGVAGMAIREVDAKERVVRAAERPRYLPVYWTDPAAGHEALIGIDEAFDALRGPAIERLRQGGGLRATPPLHSLARAATDRVVFNLYAPVYLGQWQGSPAGDATAALRPLRGVVSAMIDLGALLQTAQASVERDVDRLLQRDPQARGVAGMSWAGGAPQPWSGDTQQALRRTLLADVHEQITLRVADRQWQLLAQPRWAAAPPLPGWLQAGVFGTGLAFTALLTGFMVTRRRREQALEQSRASLEGQVAERTEALAGANRSLQGEVEERRVLEDQLREASRQAEAASQAKSMFLANMSHEIRTPLNAVLGYAQLLLEEERLDPPSRERIGAILAAGQRLLQLINDVLDLSKIEAGGLVLRDEPFELAKELEDAVALIGPKALTKGLVLDVELALPAHEWVQGDGAKVGQIVLNLLSNAVKFSSHGRIALRASRTGDAVQIDVSDRGPGITLAEQAQLFSPFRQGRAGAEKGGTGLGLTLSRRLARAMGGDLKLHSTNGQGTRVSLLLPLPPLPPLQAGLPEGRAADAPMQRLDPATPCRVLVVEDDPPARDILMQALQRIGCEVLVAADGEAALALCRPGAVDIVFTDIRMPVLDGLALRRRLLQDPLLAQVPVVAVTASSLVHERRHYLSEGFQDFISKPYSFGEIYRALARHAGVRFISKAAVPVPVPLPTVAAPAPLPPAQAAAGLTAAAAPALWALADAAASGAPGRVQAALAQLDPAWLGAAQHQSLLRAAQAYDFGWLEPSARALAAAATHQESPPEPRQGEVDG